MIRAAVLSDFWQMLNSPEGIRNFSLAAVLARLILAVLIGGVIGLERRYRNRAAGFRTYILVCLGATLVSMTGVFLAINLGGDPSRMSAQVISGIGFLGVGTIIVTRSKHVRGLTTATGLWVAAAVGLALGAGFYGGAILVGLFAFATMTVFYQLELWLLSRRKHLFVRVELRAGVESANFMRRLRQMGLDVVEIGYLDADETPAVSARLDLQIGRRGGRADTALIEEIAALPEVRRIVEIEV